jgi:hypothetical protein
VTLCVQPLVRDRSTLELGEQRLEPERVLVEDRDRLLHLSRNEPTRRGVPDQPRRLGVPLRDARLRPELGEADDAVDVGVVRDLDAHLVQGCLGLSRDVVPFLGDDRHLLQFGQQGACKIVDLRGGHAAARKDAEVDPHFMRGRVGSRHESQHWSLVTGRAQA